MSSSVLAMLVALFSVLTTLLLNLPERKQSDLSVDYIRTDHHVSPPQIIILLRNTGNRSGSFSTADLVIERNGSTTAEISLYFRRFQGEGETGWYVGAQSGKSVFLIPSIKAEIDKFNKAVAGLAPDNKCSLNFVIKPFKGKDRFDQIFIPCSDLRLKNE